MSFLHLPAFQLLEYQIWVGGGRWEVIWAASIILDDDLFGRDVGGGRVAAAVECELQPLLLRDVIQGGAIRESSTW